MIENTKLSILCGGYYVCTSAWDRDRAMHRFHDTFDFLMPTAGSALFETDGGQCRMKPGHVYFNPGRHMVRWKCEKEMPVYWVATVPESFYLRYRLGSIKTVKSWPLASVPWMEGLFRRFVEFFKEEKIDPDRERTDDDARPRPDSPEGLGIKIEGALMLLVGDLIEATAKDFKWEDFAGLDRLRPAIDFMDEHYLHSPQLSEIASQIGIASEYFHRLFKKETGITPFKYMESRRLDLARKLLSEGRLSVKEVARQTGYQSASQFSRAFHQRFNLSPSGLRLMPPHLRGTP